MCEWKRYRIIPLTVVNFGPEPIQYFWPLDNVQTRHDGPAEIWEDGDMAWLVDGDYHRENGPAWVKPKYPAYNRKVEWYLWGVKIPRDEYELYCDETGWLTRKGLMKLRLKYG